MESIKSSKRINSVKVVKNLKRIKDDIVITGIAGKYPECKSIEEFARKLYNKQDLVTEDESRWRKDLFVQPMGMGKLDELEKFDANFFSVNNIIVDYMDSQTRILLETVYEAIWDSGTDPLSLSGTNTGVFIGNCFDEILNAHSTMGSVPLYKNFIASEVSYRYNLKGPAIACDTACASSFTALNEALNYMKKGWIDNAIVAGINLGLNPIMQFQFFKLNMLSPDGRCKCLDESANGYAKGEAVVAVLLRRKPFAKRIYATLIHTKTNNDGYEEMGITYPTWESQRDLMKATYLEAGINPHDVQYVEAHCTGTQAGDPEEMRAICESMCSGDRKTPVLIGAHKSNIGHTEASSGLCAISKVLISLENELIPSNIHCKTPNTKIEGITKGLLKPINENTPFFGDIVGLNNFGFGGSNIHVIIKSPKIKPSIDNNKIIDKMPRLVTMCGRDESAVNYFFEELFEIPNKITRDLLSLVNDISKTSPFKSKSTALYGMSCRGFALIESMNQNLQEMSDFNAREVKEEDRKVWFVMSGMGTQWTAMAKDLISIDIFEKSIRSLCEVMKKYSIDLWDLLINDKHNICDSVMHSFLTIAAIQIALIDFLEELGIKPDGIVGHSIGELVCAYADKCLTAEETIVMAYWRAKVIEDNASTRGRMAAIGLGVKDAKVICPQSVFIACDNSDDSITVAGNGAEIEEFVKQIKNKGIFAANVESSGIAFHSPLMYSIGEPLTEKLKTVFNNTRKMSSKWISANFNNKSDKITAHYFVDNLLYPIRFNDALKQIPSNAIVVEISPHCLLQSILKRSLGPNISYVPLMRKNDNNLNLLLSSVGTLYTLGLNPEIEKLYPKVNYPVSNGTKFISPLVKWVHDKDYTVTKFPEFFSNSQISKTIMTRFNLLDKEDQYIIGHVIDGRNLYPGTGYLLLVWKHLAAFNNTEYFELPVEFRDVVFHRATIVQFNKELKFQTNIETTNGDFVLTENDAVVVTGNIKALKTGMEFQYYLEENSYKISKTENLVLKKEDVYTGLRLRGYDYGKSFQCISDAYIEDRKVKAMVEWIDNWVVFSDNMIQIGIVGVESKGLYIPVRIDLIRFDPKALMAEVSALGDNPKLEAFFDYDTRIGVTKGLEYRGMKANLVQRNLNLSSLCVGDYGFVKFEGMIVNDNEAEITDYRSVCDKMAQSLNQKLDLKRSVGKSAKIINTKTEEIVKAMKGKDKQLFHLLSELNKTNEFNAEDIKDNKHFEDLSDDLLMKNIYNCLLIDSQLIMVYDNKKALDVKVLELNDSYESIKPSVETSLDPHDFFIKLNYTLASRPSNKTVGADSKSIQWAESQSTIPSNIKDLDHIIYKNDNNPAMNLTDLCQTVMQSLKANAFFQIIFRNSFTESEKFINNLLNRKSHTMSKNEIKSVAEKCGFTYIGWTGNQFGANTMLFRKIPNTPELEKQVFIPISNDYTDWLARLQEVMANIHTRPEGENIWLIGNNTSKNGILGLVYSLRKENNGMRIRSIFNFNDIKDKFLQNKEDLEAIVKKDLVYNNYIDGQWGFHKPNIKSSIAKYVETEHCFLNTSTRGDLSSLKWFECQHKLWPIGRKPHQTLCNVYYSALNFRDIMLASGRLPADALPGDIALQDCILGLEFSGRDENGNRVMGMIPSKALATTCVIDDPDFLWPIPENWSMEEASTVPCVYATAYYSLIIRGGLKKGEKVLIHSGSGGVGQAAINICLSLGCQLFITVGTDAKREFLKKLFPKLTNRNFSSSRDLTFKTHVIQETNGAGVDLVLNSLSDDKLVASIECLANNGRFLEIGKYDMSVNTKLDMSEMIKNKSFHGILLDALFTTDENTPKMILKDRKRIWDLISNGIKTGTVKPLNRTVFASDECEEAFRFMSSGKHMGKVVIRIRDEEPMDAKISNKGFTMRAIARTVFNPNKVYIITGGLGGFGLELMDWMVDRDAKKFLITSRTGPTTGYQKMKLKRLRELYGADIHIVTDLDLSSPKEATTLLSIGLQMGPIGGVFHLALVLADGLFENQTEESFKTICRSKSDPFLMLDIVSRKYCPDLDYFVCFSSGVTSRGNLGQTNYGFSNAILDRVCEVRKRDGYNALSIQWGVIGDVGVVVKTTGNDDVVIVGTIAQRMPSCLHTLDQILQTDKPIALSFVTCEPKHESVGGKDNFLKKLCHILGMDDIKKLDPNTKFLKLGMDSLMAVEIQLSIEREFGVVLSAQDVRELNIARVVEIAEEAKE